MTVYIKGMGNISPQKSWGETLFLQQPVGYPGNRLTAIEPDYDEFIDPKVSRRMSRIIKMGIAAATMALNEAGVKIPDAIITGTGYGCLEDTGTFLGKMILNKEDALNPTPFIQSTHNTIGSQIALLLQCQFYNQTYTHEGFSFENALVDAMMQVRDDETKNVLVGGVDEITAVSHAIQSRFGIFKTNLVNSLALFHPPSAGTVNGEGAAFFVLSGSRSGNHIAGIEGITTFYKPDHGAIQNHVLQFFSDHNVDTRSIDVVLSGKSGDVMHDSVMDQLASEIFPQAGIGVFKHLCGEYPVASSFGLWLSATMMRDQKSPDVIWQKGKPEKMRRIVILNQYFGKHFSLILLKNAQQ
jgi:3-oxoacyl-[acyl-carrier-protein] synthase II